MHPYLDIVQHVVVLAAQHLLAHMEQRLWIGKLAFRRLPEAHLADMLHSISTQ